MMHLERQSGDHHGHLPGCLEAGADARQESACGSGPSKSSCGAAHHPSEASRPYSNGFFLALPKYHVQLRFGGSLKGQIAVILGGD